MIGTCVETSLIYWFSSSVVPMKLEPTRILNLLFGKDQIQVILLELQIISGVCKAVTHNRLPAAPVPDNKLPL